jgi:hypothetical protein
MPLLNRDALSRCQGELATPFRKVLYLVPTGQGSSGQPMLFVYDYIRDLWDSYLEPGSARTIWSIGRFFRPSDETSSYGSLVGTYGAQTFRYGMEPVGSLGESILYGSSVGNIDEIGFARETYRGENRLPIIIGPAIYINKPAEEGVLCRVTVTYRQPRTANAPILNVSLVESENATTPLGSDSFQLLNSEPGRISKAYFDFIVASERVQAHIEASGDSSQVEILEISAEVTDAGVETASS